MDARLVAWARAVKARRRQAGLIKSQIPVLWLFTDEVRCPDPLAAIERLPPALCGVVFRHDNATDRAELGLAVARACRKRRLALCVAGNSRLATRLGSGMHMRAGSTATFFRLRSGALVTASAHNRLEVLRAVKAGASLVFLSPIFETASHPGAASLGTVRWRLGALRAGAPILALGGIDGRSARRLPGSCAGAGAISALC